jgi:hypothetical protein
MRTFERRGNKMATLAARLDEPEWGPPGLYVRGALALWLTVAILAALVLWLALR